MNCSSPIPKPRVPARAPRARRTRYALALGVALAGLPALAEQSPATRDTVVVTGSALPTDSAEIGGSLTVITADQIEAGGYVFAGDALRQIPGVSINRGGSFGAVTQVRTRGSEGNHTLVLLDGIDLSRAGLGETDLAGVLTNDIERIEVLRGPQSGLYGSNALAGVINLVTRRDIDGFYVHGAAEAGSFETADLQASAGVGDGASYLAGGFQSFSTEGYDVSTLNTTAGVGARAGDKEGARVAAVQLRGGMKVSPVLRFDLIARYVNRTADGDGQAFAPPIFGQTFDDPSLTRSHDFDLGGSAMLSLLDNRWVTILSASRVATDLEGESYDFTGVPAIDATASASPNGMSSARNRLLLQSSYSFGAPAFQNRVTGFVESKTERYRNTRPFPGATEQGEVQTRDLTGFGLEYRASIQDQLFLGAVVRHDDNDHFEDANTWSVSAAWAIPNTSIRLHTSYGTGVTNPTFTEQFGFDPASFVGNPDLKPEESKGWDAGFEAAFANRRVIVDLTYFDANLENEIITVFGSAPLFLSTAQNNQVDSDRSGVEVSVQLHPTANIDISGAYTWLDASEPAGIELRRPEHSGGVDARWRIGGGPLELDLGVTYTGEQYDTDFSTFARRAISDFTLVRLGARYALSDTVEAYVRVENLLDEDYEEVIGFRGAPQAAYVGLRFKAGSAK